MEFRRELRELRSDCSDSCRLRHAKARTQNIAPLSLEGVSQMDSILPERLLALVRPAFDLVLRRIQSLKRCVQACGCKIMTPTYAVWQTAQQLPLFLQGKRPQRKPWLPRHTSLAHSPTHSTLPRHRAHSGPGRHEGLRGKPYPFMLVAIDALTKKVAAEPLKDRLATTTAAGAKKVFQALGVPANVYSDDGSEFKREFKELMNFWTSRSR